MVWNKLDMKSNRECFSAFGCMVIQKASICGKVIWTHGEDKVVYSLEMLKRECFSAFGCMVNHKAGIYGKW